MKKGDYFTAKELSRTSFIPLYDYGKFPEFEGKICTVKRKLRTLTDTFILKSEQSVLYRDMKPEDVILCITAETHPEYFL